MKLNSNDMPKIESPFIRENINDMYVCTPKIRDEYKWVFEDSIAVEKLDGTNVSIEIKNNTILNINNRLNNIELWKKGNSHFVTGILESIDREYIQLSSLVDGNYFGELVGPKVQANQYGLKTHLWIPFTKIEERFTYKFWEKFVIELKGLSDKEIYDKTSTLFKGLWSICKRKYGLKGDEVTENTKFEGLASEGIVFYNPERTKMSKLRRDMFEWYKGERHGTN